MPKFPVTPRAVSLTVPAVAKGSEGHRNGLRTVAAFGWVMPLFDVNKLNRAPCSMYGIRATMTLPGVPDPSPREMLIGGNLPLPLS